MGRTTFLLCIAFDLIPPSSTKSCAAKPLDFGVPSGVHSSRWAFDHCADAQEVFGKEVVAERRFFLHGNWTFRSVFDMLKLVKICSCNYCTVVSQPHEIGIFTLKSWLQSGCTTSMRSIQRAARLHIRCKSPNHAEHWNLTVLNLGGFLSHLDKSSMLFESFRFLLISFG